MKKIFIALVTTIAVGLIFSGGCTNQAENVGDVIVPPDSIFLPTPKNLRVDSASIKIYTDSAQKKYYGKFLIRWDRIPGDPMDMNDTLIKKNQTDTNKLDTIIYMPPYNVSYFIMTKYGNNVNSRIDTTRADTVKIDSLPPNGLYTVNLFAVKRVRVTVTFNGKDTTIIAFAKSKDPATLVISDLFQPLPPGNVAARYDGSSAISVSWSPDSRVKNSEYRVYLRDSAGAVLDSIVNKDSSRSIVYFPSSLANKTVVPDKSYKINIRAVNRVGLGVLCSAYVYDNGSNSDNGFKLPYLYLSTYSVPSPILTDSFARGMIGVPGGMFGMGNIWKKDSLDKVRNSAPVHEVVLSSFYLGAAEITCSQYVRFLNSLDTAKLIIKDSITIDTIKKDTSIILTYLLKDSAENDTIMHGNKKVLRIVKKDSIFIIDTISYASYPVTSVTWVGAAAFCNWLSKICALDTCYDRQWKFIPGSKGYRLPTEAEFEYVHSASFTGTKQRFSWGYVIDQSKYASQVTKKSSVGKYIGYNGFYDMSGNAAEWCNDFSDFSASSDTSAYFAGCLKNGIVFNPLDSSDNSKGRILRGGSFQDPAIGNCSVWRSAAAGCDEDIGFRIARSK